jgi:hypothetical protein
MPSRWNKNGRINSWFETEPEKENDLEKDFPTMALSKSDPPALRKTEPSNKRHFPFQVVHAHEQRFRNPRRSTACQLEVRWVRSCEQPGLEVRCGFFHGSVQVSRGGSILVSAIVPIKESVPDYTGKERKFEITMKELGLGFLVEAEEVGKKGLGYHFSAFSPNSPYLALGRLREKIIKALATRHVIVHGKRCRPLHDIIEGRIDWDREKEQMVFVVDGRPMSLEQLGKMMNMHEGWNFSLRFIDRSD